MTIQAVHRLLCARERSCAELTKEYLKTIKRDDPCLNAFITLSVEHAVASVLRVDEKLARGEEIDLLAGVPMTLKDNLSTCGIRTTCGARMLENYTPLYDATVWERLRSRGGILIGKSNLDEFAMGSTGETSYFGPTKHPMDPTRVPGGSSGGTACAVAAGLAVYGLGSDTGGSIRQPASFCGVVGMKPTYGAVSRYGLVAHASSLDQIGPIAATAEDVAIVYDAICAPDPKDATCVGGTESALAHLCDPLNGLRVGVVTTGLEWVEPMVAAALERAATVLERLGAQLVPIALPLLKYAVPAYRVIASAEAASNLARFDGIRYGRSAGDVVTTRTEGFGGGVKRRIVFGTYVLQQEQYERYYQKAVAFRRQTQKMIDEAWERCDVLLTPTASTVAFQAPAAPHAHREDVFFADGFTASVNLAGLPAVSVPCGSSLEGLPIGMQLIGKRFDDARLLNVANQFEHATDAVFLRQGVTR